ncbi:cob(I)yrinic acid a,c-diamide adenosyltransferase [Deferribacter autotrophicus]|uniref:corrinoid adenosyltransferase n=1 Tax=Deferribacter autotrophicus TaxID=500465 RepID=A0A5A8F7G5_9BACT|nr:cob(I)yrinic acid a,c-diamide adenosyltransferase [Deferribacter autotrophicus]KAA0258978.1 cob(I)yrinic acid a,c-diamide adenosyltransferase [Deferribacter autotrophicus]
MMLDRGFIQVYTGNGKGKTTAAIGLSIRAAGAGLRVFFAQFLKTAEYNEHNILRQIENIEVKTYGRGCLIRGKPEEIDYRLASAGFNEVKRIIESAQYDLVVLDEINVVVYYGLIETELVLSLIRNKPENVELVLTGRYAPKEFIDNADLVTEFKEVKHYFHQGILAREGIEK